MSSPNNEDSRMSSASPPSTPTFANGQVLIDSPPPSQTGFTESARFTGAEEEEAPKKEGLEKSFKALLSPQYLKDQTAAEETLVESNFKLGALGDPFDESNMFK